MRVRVSVTIGCVGLIVVLAGCLAGTGIGGTPPTPQPSTAPGATSDGCPKWVSFYGLGSPGETLWAPDEIAIGYTVPANTSVLFVAYENGTVLGVNHVSTEGLEYGVTADGDRVSLGHALEGTHTLRVVAYRDVDANGEFDSGTDRPCKHDGEVVDAGPKLIDFSEIDFEPPSGTEGGPPTGTPAT